MYSTLLKLALTLYILLHVANSFNQAYQAMMLDKHRSYKTQACMSFSKYGSCKYATDCRFAHGDKELRSRTNPPNFKTTLCRNEIQGAVCPYGAKCDFVHRDDPPIQPRIQEFQNASSNRTSTLSDIMMQNAFEAIDARNIRNSGALSTGTSFTDYTASPGETLTEGYTPRSFHNQSTLFVPDTPTHQPTGSATLLQLATNYDVSTFNMQPNVAQQPGRNNTETWEQHSQSRFNIFGMGRANNFYCSGAPSTISNGSEISLFSANSFFMM